MMRARIYRCPKKATQSGHAFAHMWILEFGQSSPRHHDPLMGWVGSNDTISQIRLKFATQEDAVGYANRKSIPYDLEAVTPHRSTPKIYEDNYAFTRKMNWTH